MTSSHRCWAVFASHSSMKGSPLFLCLFSTMCWVNLMPTAGNRIFHFGPCRVSMSVAEIRSGFTAIKANIVSICSGLLWSWGRSLVAPPEPVCASPSPSCPLQQARDPIRTLSILSYPHSLHKVKVGILTLAPLLFWIILTSQHPNTPHGVHQLRAFGDVVQHRDCC